VRYISRFAVLLKRLGVIIISLVIIFAVLNIYRALIPNVWYRRHLALSLIGLWLLSAYLVLPRIHRILSKIYLPGYFVGRTRTLDGLLGDPINLAVNGSKKALIAAMQEAGWKQADQRTIKTSARIVLSALLGRSYPNAPVSDLYVFGNRQDLVFQIQDGGNPRKRHHVRFWRVPRRWYLPGGYKVDWVGAATFDDAVGISLFTWQITHSIDANVDDERDFLIKSLQDVNMLRSSTRVEHYFVGYKSRNGVNGSHMVTDGSLVIADLVGESHTRSASGVQHASLDSIQQEIYNLARARAGKVSKKEVGELVEEIEAELDDVKDAYKDKESSRKVSEETVDVLIKAVQLVGALGHRASDIYRDKMDKAWEKQWHEEERKK
jgi:hypothetical protein